VVVVVDAGGVVPGGVGAVVVVVVVVVVVPSPGTVVVVDASGGKVLEGTSCAATCGTATMLSTAATTATVGLRPVNLTPSEQQDDHDVVVGGPNNPRRVPPMGQGIDFSAIAPNVIHVTPRRCRRVHLRDTRRSSARQLDR
jgi:hypothetical protein